MDTELTADLLGRMVVNPYPILDDFRANPIIFWDMLQKEYKHVSQDINSFNDVLSTELILKDHYPFLERAIRSPAKDTDGWMLSWTNYYLPIPNRPGLVRLKCRDDLARTYYFKARISTEDINIQYMNEPTISLLSKSAHAYEKENPEARWMERITKTNRRAERTAQQLHKQLKIYGETQALFKCIPGKTYLIQDCFWGQPDNIGAVPAIQSNKQLLIMSDQILKEEENT